MPLSRKELQRLAEARLKDAEALFDRKRFDGAYYLAGYAIECALKACIAKKTRKYDFPDKEFFQESYIHDLQKLMKPAGLSGPFRQEFLNNPALAARWNVVKDGSEKSRYQRHGRQKAQDMLTAVSERQGVLACIRKYW